MMCFRPDVIKRNYAFDIDEYAMRGVSRPPEIKKAPQPPIPVAEPIIPQEVKTELAQAEIPAVVKEQSVKKVTVKRPKPKRWFPEMNIVSYKTKNTFLPDTTLSLNNQQSGNQANIHCCRGGPL